MSSSEEKAVLDELVRRAPSFEPVYAEHMGEYGELLGHVLMADFTRWLVAELRRRDTADLGARGDASPDLEGILRFLEERWDHGNQEVRDLIGASFIENLWQAEDYYLRVKGLLAVIAPHLTAQLNRVE
jgi:hypothetical protein